MRKLFMFSFAIVLISLLVGCEDGRRLASSPAMPEGDGSNSFFDYEQIATELVSKIGWQVESGADQEGGAVPKALFEPAGFIEDFEREVVVGDIAHYSFEVRVGPEPFDVIGIHRVVKERAPYQPIRSRKPVFLLHGDWINFTGCFLPGTISPTAPADFGLAVVLAEGGVDVWGIDQAWNLVPEETTDFSFMADWGIQKEVDNLNSGVTIARLARRATGNGYGKMILLGYSSGVFTGYALLNQETQIPPGHRQIKGFIPVDSDMKTDWEELLEGDEAYRDYLQELHDSGVYADYILFQPMADLARNFPDDESPFFPPLTNWQAVIFLGAGTLFGDTHIHYIAGIWEDDLPVDFRYFVIDRWLDFMEQGAYYEPLQFTIEFYTVELEDEDLPFDDYLHEITVPILYVGTAGGFGTELYTAGLVGSTDITELGIQLESPEDVLYDFAHIDVWLADNAPELVWQPVLEWVNDHSRHGHGGRDVSFEVQ